MRDENYSMNIAIVGMAGKFPKADDVNEFWNNLLNGRDCISRINVEKENEDILYAYGAINRPFHFDYSFFGISKGRAKEIAPQERVLLEVSYQALEDAGCVADNYKGKIGIVCGAPENEYRTKLAVAAGLRRGLSDKEYTGSSLASRVSYRLNLTGPSLMVVAACATSMVSVHEACHMLLNYEADVMLAGGSNIYTDQEKYVSVENLVSKDGFGRAFDKNSTGLIPGNGVAMVVLKRLEDAIQDSDHIYAVIRSSATGNDGNRKVGFTAPSIQGEKEVIQEAMMYGGITSNDFSFIETHGTGTNLGDAIELRALNEVLSYDRTLTHKIPIGALKNNYGHLNMTAGIAGIMKTALVLKTHLIPPIINVTDPNEELNEDSLVYINQEVSEIPLTENTVIGGVSSFGFGGINAHMILEEYREENKEVKEDEEMYLLPISAKSKYSLKRMVERYKEWVPNNKAILSRASNMLFKYRNNFDNRGYLVVCKGEILHSSELVENYSECNLRNKGVVFDFDKIKSIKVEEFRKFYTYCKTFRFYFDECMSIIKAASEKNYDVEDVVMLSIVSQYSLAKTFESLGIIPEKLYYEKDSIIPMALFNKTIDIETAVEYLKTNNVAELERFILNETSNKGKYIYCLASDVDTENVSYKISLNIFKNDIILNFLKQLGELWVRKNDFSTDFMFSDEELKKVSLPTYCFDGEYLNILDEYYPQTVAFDIDKNDFEYFKHIEKEADAELNIKSLRDYNGLTEAFDEICRATALAYFNENRIKLNTKYSLVELEELCGVTNYYKPYVKFLLGILCRSNDAVYSNNKYIINNKYSYKELIGTFESNKVKFCDFNQYIDIVQKCVMQMDSVLTGKVFGNSIIYPEGNFDMLSEIHDNTPEVSLRDSYIKSMTKVLKKIVDKSNKRLRILEVGSGTGALTWEVLEALKDADIEYFITDIGRSFVTIAEKTAKEKGYKNVYFNVFDIEKDFKEAGFRENTFDIVLSLDVLQATSNITNALSNINKLLKPCGWMISVQTLLLQDFTQLIFGYAPGWWNYGNDPLRKDKSIYVDFNVWKKAYEDAEFENVSCITGGYNDRRKEVSLIFAKKPYALVEDDIPFSMAKNHTREAVNVVVAKTGEKHTGMIGDLVNIIKEVIGVEEINLDDDIYSAGIDSLSLLIIRSKIKEKFNVNFSINEFDQCESVREAINKIINLRIDNKNENTNNLVKESTEKNDISKLFELIQYK
ncbi:beta-ketoacyl synthase N-terminal-like domain-containing protein [Clostridium sp. LP20]|uniref:beta-ketoacyl synthase N-terminal-like domain-containing protein n=1 Tax=Clostridium sp. LP20 TaxID=3418665 RepID=UPI003EE4359A